MEFESNLEIKEKIIEKTEETKKTYTNNLETIEKQNELIENNFNKLVDVNNQLKESSSLIGKIKRRWCDCFKSKPRKKMDNMNKISIINNSENYEKKNRVGFDSKYYNKKLEINDNKNNIFEEQLLNELDDIHNLSKIQNEQIINQNKILTSMNSNTSIVNDKIKKNNNEIRNI